MPTIEPFVHVAAVREGAWQRLEARLLSEPGCDWQAEKAGQRRACTPT